MSRLPLVLEQAHCVSGSLPGKNVPIHPGICLTDGGDIYFADNRTRRIEPVRFAYIEVWTIPLDFKDGIASIIGDIDHFHLHADFSSPLSSIIVV